MSEGKSLRVLLVNPGTHPEMGHQAVGLLKAGFDVTYASSSMWSTDSWLMAVARKMPGPVRAHLLRRELPEGLGRRHVIHRAVFFEVLHLLSRSFAPRLSVKLIRLRNRYYVRRLAFRFDADAYDLLICQAPTASVLFRKAGANTLRVLNYPIAHHRWSKAFLQEEATTNPEWAPYLQGHDLSAEQSARLDLEVELAQIILVGSDFVERTFVASGTPPEKMRVLPLAVDTTKFAPRDHLASRAGDPLKLLFVGQVNQRKGIGYLVEALDSFPPGTFELRAIGAVNEALQEVLERHGIEVLGPRTPDEIRDALQWCDLFVLPSLVEGFALVVLEAMSSARPVLVSTHTTDSRYVKDGVTGYVVEPRSTAQVQQALTRALSDRDRLPDMGAEAEMMVAHQTWDNYATATGHLFTSMLREGRAEPNDLDDPVM